MRYINLLELKNNFSHFNLHEQLYKKYHLLQTQEEQEHFLQMIADSPDLPKNLWLPGFWEQMNISTIQEAFIFKKYPNRSIYLQKHNRYTPALFHKHDFFELIYVYSGSAKHEINNEISILSKGDLLIISPDIEHSLWVFSDSIVLEALIKKSTFSTRFFEFLKEHNTLSSFFRHDLYTQKHYPYITFQTNKNKELETIFMDMFIESYNTDSFSDTILNNLLMIYFSKLMRYFQHEVKLPVKKNKQQERIDCIMSYIHNNYTTITLTALAKHVHFAPAYLSAYIKEHTGVTYIHLLQSIRLNRAKDLLIHSNLSIYDISEQIGYTTPCHLIRLFKKKYNVTPTYYRQAHKTTGD